MMRPLRWRLRKGQTLPFSSATPTDTDDRRRRCLDATRTVQNTRCGRTAASRPSGLRAATHDTRDFVARPCGATRSQRDSRDLELLSGRSMGIAAAVRREPIHHVAVAVRARCAAVFGDEFPRSRSVQFKLIRTIMAGNSSQSRPRTCGELGAVGGALDLLPDSLAGQPTAPDDRVRHIKDYDRAHGALRAGADALRGDYRRCAGRRHRHGVRERRSMGLAELAEFA